MPVFTTKRANDARTYSARALRLSARVPGVSANLPIVTWRLAAVIGAGTMGTGISTALVVAGIEVCLIDLSQEALPRAAAQVQRKLEAEKARGRMDAG